MKFCKTYFWNGKYVSADWKALISDTAAWLKRYICVVQSHMGKKFNLHCHSSHRGCLVTWSNRWDLPHQPHMQVSATIDYKWSTVYQVGWYYLVWGEVRTHYVIAVITDCEHLNPSLPMSLINSRPTTQSELLDPLSLSVPQRFRVAPPPDTPQMIEK